MAFVTERQLREKARRVAGRKTVEGYKREQITASSEGKTFDVFLSHSYLDQELVLGAKQAIEEKGYSVFVDWIDAAEELRRERVSSETANYLREKMKICTSLVYAHTKNSSLSRWCPWELGYFDALKGAVFILPIVNYSDDNFARQEYLGLYPYLSSDCRELVEGMQKLEMIAMLKALKSAIEGI